MKIDLRSFLAESPIHRLPPQLHNYSFQRRETLNISGGFFFLSFCFASNILLYPLFSFSVSFKNVKSRKKKKTNKLHFHISPCYLYSPLFIILSLPPSLSPLSLRVTAFPSFCSRYIHMYIHTTVCMCVCVCVLVTTRIRSSFPASKPAAGKPTAAMSAHLLRQKVATEHLPCRLLSEAGAIMRI